MSRHPLWYKDAIIYQAHVRAFFDSNNDGVGDFAGLTQKLDYLQGLGISALWLMPFYPSPLRDDGYDIADYENIHPSYGTLDDFDRFLEEAHRRDIRVMEAEEGNVDEVEEFESDVGLELRPVHALVVPGPGEGAPAERVAAFPGESVPIGDRRTDVVLHPLA